MKFGMGTDIYIIKVSELVTLKMGDDSVFDTSIVRFDKIKLVAEIWLLYKVSVKVRLDVSLLLP